MTIHPAVILAGGRSTRMGQDKALLQLAGISLLERVARTAREVCPHLLIVGRSNAPDHWPTSLAASFLPDSPTCSPDSSAYDRSAGPLAGLITALEHLQTPLLLLACDTPLITPDLLRALIAAHSPSSFATISISQTTGRSPQAEPTLAIYTPSLLPMLHAKLRENRRSLQALSRVPNVHTWPIPTRHQQELFNINDLATLAQAEALLNAPPANGDN